MTTYYFLPPGDEVYVPIPEICAALWLALTNRMRQICCYVTFCSFPSHPLGMLPLPRKEAESSLPKNEKPCGGELWQPSQQPHPTALSLLPTDCKFRSKPSWRHKEQRQLSQPSLPELPTQNHEQINHRCFMPLSSWNVVCYMAVNWEAHWAYLLPWA